MGWFEATIVFITGLIVFMVILPIGTALLPDIRSSMGSNVVIMISAMFVIILVALFFVYMRGSQQPDNFMSGGGELGGQQY